MRHSLVAYVEFAVELSDIVLADDPHLAPSVDGAATTALLFAPLGEREEAAGLGGRCCYCGALRVHALNLLEEQTE